MTRAEALDDLLSYYLENLVEDPIDGTIFDCKIIDMIQELKNVFTD